MTKLLYRELLPVLSEDSWIRLLARVLLRGGARRVMESLNCSKNESIKTDTVFNRPGVAGAALQTASSLID